MQREWRTYRVPARENEAAEGRQYSDVRADELTDTEKADLTPAMRAEVEEDLVAMDSIGADAPWAWRDHEFGRDTDRPMAAAAE